MKALWGCETVSRVARQVRRLSVRPIVAAAAGMKEPMWAR